MKFRARRNALVLHTADLDRPFVTYNAELLELPDVQVAEVAFLLGYEDSNSFYRAFRTWKGTTPAHWRTSLTGRDDARRVRRTIKLP